MEGRKAGGKKGRREGTSEEGGGWRIMRERGAKGKQEGSRESGER